MMTALTSSQALARLPLLSKGLLTTFLGLLGVFLVLALFYLTIRLIQRAGSKQP